MSGNFWLSHEVRAPYGVVEVLRPLEGAFCVTKIGEVQQLRQGTWVKVANDPTVLKTVRPVSRPRTR